MADDNTQIAKLTKVATKELEQLKVSLELKQVTRGFSVLNENQVQKLFNSTPRKWKFKRPAKGGGEWDYVRKGYVRRTLDSVFGFDWDYQTTTPLDTALTIAERTGFVVLQGTITARVLDSEGKTVATLKRSGTGRSEVKFTKLAKEMPDGTKRRAPLDFGNDVKGAETDCFKRCAALFGIAADIFEKDEFFEIAIVGSDETNTAVDDNVKKLTAAAKKDLEKLEGSTEKEHQKHEADNNKS
jgi:hypothetical protein